MQETKTPPPAIVPKMSRTPFYAAGAFTLIVLAMSIGLFFYNQMLENRIESEKVSIEEMKKNIDEVSKDRNVIITKIESSNTIRPAIDLKGLVNNFYDAASRARVRLKGFSIANDVISTSLTATEADGIGHPDPASTIIKMMREYSVAPQGNFALEPIISLAGDMQSRSTAVQFKIVALPTK